MQMLADKSEEGIIPGLGWIPGNVRAFSITKFGLNYLYLIWVGIN